MREAQAFGLAVRSGITMPLCTFGHLTDPVITDPSLYRVVWENTVCESTPRNIRVEAWATQPAI